MAAVLEHLCEAMSVHCHYHRIVVAIFFLGARRVQTPPVKKNHGAVWCTDPRRRPSLKKAAEKITVVNFNCRFLSQAAVVPSSNVFKFLVMFAMSYLCVASRLAQRRSNTRVHPVATCLPKMQTIPLKCTLCWEGGPPVAWDRSSAPTIPTLKQDLVQALEKHVSPEDPPLGALTKAELKHMFRQRVRGFRCFSDPTVGMSCLSKSELLTRTQRHDIAVPQDHTKGCLMACLRSHWQDQCNLAKHSAGLGLAARNPETLPPTADGEFWEFVAPGPTGIGSEELGETIAGVEAAMDEMMKATTALYRTLNDDKNQLIQRRIRSSADARASFLDSIELLLHEPSLSQDEVTSSQ